jgi:hypothetical protein
LSERLLFELIELLCILKHILIPSAVVVRIKVVCAHVGVATLPTNGRTIRCSRPTLPWKLFLREVIGLLFETGVDGFTSHADAVHLAISFSRFDHADCWTETIFVALLCLTYSIALFERRCIAMPTLIIIK